MADHFMSQVHESDFAEDLYNLYWRMVAERQNMYVRRAYLDHPRPWTSDPILGSEFITNMYREMDPGTQYVINDILSMTDPADRVFNVLLYRLMGSQATTHELIRGKAKQFKASKYNAALANVEKGKLFGDAYRVAGYETEGGATKAENIGIMFERISRQMPDIMNIINATTNARELYEAIKNLQGFGDFLAHQVSVDLLYANPDGERIVPFGDNQYATAGPGARNGIWALLKPGHKPRNMLMVMEYLRDVQQDEFAKREIVFPYLADEEGEPIHLSVCNIQSTLCEFYKYVRLWDGSTQKVRRYTASNPPSELVQLPIAMTDEELTAVGTTLQLTPRPPAGGRQVPELAKQPTPELDDTEPQTGFTGTHIAPGSIMPGAIVSTKLAADAHEDAEVKPMELAIATPAGPVNINITINVYGADN